MQLKARLSGVTV